MTELLVANLAHDLNQLFAGARISKIAQPEKDELLLTLKGTAGQKRLVLSASASLTPVYITEKNKTSPMTAPNFCMLLRKHIANGRILSVTQPGMERVLIFEVEHLNDLGDLCRKRLIVELMGKTQQSDFSARRTARSWTASSMCPHRSVRFGKCCPDGSISFLRRRERKIP